jgi:hypothetical protein
MEIEEDCLFAIAKPNQRHENLRFRFHFTTRCPQKLVVMEMEEDCLLAIANPN